MDLRRFFIPYLFRPLRTKRGIFSSLVKEPLTQLDLFTHQANRDTNCQLHQVSQVNPLLLEGLPQKLILYISAWWRRISGIHYVRVVDLTGFEPVISSLQMRRINQLCYRPESVTTKKLKVRIQTEEVMITRLTDYPNRSEKTMVFDSIINDISCCS